MEEKRPTGHQQLEIDWNKVDEHLVAGCCGTDIAGLLGVYPDTLYDRCQKEKGTTFTAYSQQKKAKGDSLLKKQQFDKAMGYTEFGDNTLLIWLGKIRMSQKETTEISVNEETRKSFDSMMNQIAEIQKNRHPGEDETDK